MVSRRRVLAACGLAAAGAATGCSALRTDRQPPVEGSWPRRGANSARTGYDPEGRGPREDPSPAWTAPVPNRGASPSPAVADGTVFVGAQGESTFVEDRGNYAPVDLLAFDAATGERRWRTTVADARLTNGTDGFRDSVVVAGDRVYLQTTAGLHAVTTDGQTRWTFRNAVADGFDVDRSHPVVGDGTVYVGSFGTPGYDVADPGRPLGSTLYAVDARDGSERWRHTVPAGDERSEPSFVSPALDDGILYAGLFENGVVAVDAADGSRLWRTDLRTWGSPTVGGNLVYVPTVRDDESAPAPEGTLRTFLAALDPQTGSVAWRRPAPAGPDRNVVVADGRVYCDGDGHVFAYDAATGEFLWSVGSRASGASDGVGIAVDGSTLAGAGDALYVAGYDWTGSSSGRRSLFALDRASGGILARVGVRFWGTASIAPVDGMAYLWGNGELLAVAGRR